jgi:acyl-CoA thioesterase-1
MRTGGVLAVSAVAVLVGACSSSVGPPTATSSSSGSAVSSESTETSAQAESTEASSTPAGEPGAVRYLALGDSLTQGVGVPDEATGAFPALLSEHWRSDGCTVELQNAGISGYTAQQVLTEEIPQIDEFKPTLITFQAGGNDLVNGVTLEDYRDHVDDILDAASDSGARVIVLAQNEWFRAPSGQGYTTPEARDEFDKALIEEAQDHGAEFVDLRRLYKQQADENLWVEDGIHPTPEAYQAWADELATKVPAPCRA